MSSNLQFFAHSNLQLCALENVNPKISVKSTWS